MIGHSLGNKEGNGIPGCCAPSLLPEKFPKTPSAAAIYLLHKVHNFYFSAQIFCFVYNAILNRVWVYSLERCKKFFFCFTYTHILVFSLCQSIGA